MKLPKELINGFIIFIGVGLYFLLMEVLGLADLFYLRLINFLFVFYGVNRSLTMNISEGKKRFAFNAVSAIKTSLIGVSLSIFAIMIYSFSKGGDDYVQTLSENFLFGGDPKVITYCISLLLEGIVSSVIVAFCLMLYWNNRFSTD
jgi:hypothetical protein